MFNISTNTVYHNLQFLTNNNKESMHIHRLWNIWQLWHNLKLQHPYSIYRNISALSLILFGSAAKRLEYMDLSHRCYIMKCTSKA